VREIVLDTETTGIGAEEGHRIISLGCVEVLDKNRIGQKKHWFFNPERDVPEESFKIHGISEDFLADHPKFAEQAEEILTFLGNSTLVIHNSAFDMGFLNMEFAKCGTKPLTNKVKDTLSMARQLFPGEKAKLDALAQKFNVAKLQEREKHGALLDAEILCEVYFKLKEHSQSSVLKQVYKVKDKRKETIIYLPTAQEKATHQKLMTQIQKP